MTHGIERLFSNGLFGGWNMPRSPSLARAAVSGVGWRGCLAADVGPTLGAQQLIDTDRVDDQARAARLPRRGRVEQATALPLERTVDGLRQAAAGSTRWSPRRAAICRAALAGTAARETVCDPRVLLLGVCGGTAVHVVGTGTAQCGYLRGARSHA